MTENNKPGPELEEEKDELGDKNKYDYVFQLGLLLMIIPAGYPGTWSYMGMMAAGGAAVALGVYTMLTRQNGQTEELRKTVNRIRKYALLSLYVAPVFYVAMVFINNRDYGDNLAYLGLLGLMLGVFVLLLESYYRKLLAIHKEDRKKDQPKANDAIIIGLYVFILAGLIFFFQM
ncbi:hypothetical protein CR205_14060 [Alteribacter lacisalsi]|uniref:Uncharacterized protein n=1 Tax=Alteribacter lacisalsi TaxID=2045244 RepID=A0A2W0H737_9BACI|nr:hypothetical protein [Alteribacter lacisalsi]PYZ96801.1 hypothetical protein CR205_14060 [Alteribacter lacisalsi]